MRYILIFLITFLGISAYPDQLDSIHKVILDTKNDSVKISLYINHVLKHLQDEGDYATAEKE